MAMPGGYDDESDEEFYFGDEECIQKCIADIRGVSKDSAHSGEASPASSTTHKPDNANKQASLSKVRLEDFRMALTQGRMEDVKKALEQGMDVNSVFSNGWTALMYAGNFAQGDIFIYLLEKGADPKYQNNMYDVLMATCGAKWLDERSGLDCVKLLIEKGANVNVYDRYHTTPLMYAAREGHVEMIKLLLDKGASIDYQSFEGWTALSWATQRRKLGAIKVLLERGADQNKKHKDHLCAIDLAEGKEEIVRLFRGQTLPQNKGAGDASDMTAAAESPPGNKIRDGSIKSGDLEVFLSGLSLSDTYNLFLEHEVDFPLLLTFNEEDLKNMGIDKVGVRKKIMEGVAGVHKKNWESSSLVPIRTKTDVSCPDAIAILANLSKHLRYMSSSVVYVNDQIKHDARFLALSEESSDPKQLLLHTRDAMKNSTTLMMKCKELNSILSKELSGEDYTPPDYVSGKRAKRKFRTRRLVFSVIGVSALIMFVWKKHFVVQNIQSLVDSFRLCLMS